jgi:hypothetical protein
MCTVLMDFGALQQSAESKSNLHVLQDDDDDRDDANRDDDDDAFDDELQRARDRNKG